MTYDSFKGVTNINNLGFADNLSENFSMYLDWCLINIGAKLSSGPTYQDDTSQLHKISSTVFEGFRGNWLPGSVTGVYADGVPVSGYTINYRDGRIILHSPATDVHAYYDFPLYQIYQTRTSPWFKQVIYGDWNSVGDGFLQVGSGSMDIL